MIENKMVMKMIFLPKNKANKINRLEKIKGIKQIKSIYY